MVKGTLVCDTTGTANGNSALVDTPLVPLSAKGDARSEADIGPLPFACVNEPNLAFLIPNSRRRMDRQWSHTRLRRSRIKELTGAGIKLPYLRFIRK